MSKETEIEDSLLICKEINKNSLEEENKIEYKEKTFEEIDRILQSDYEVKFEKVALELPETEVGIIEDGEEEGEEYIERHPWLRMILSIAICMFLALILSIIITKFVAHHTSVEGSSMENTLQNADQLIVENLSYYQHEPERFDVVVFSTNEDVSYVKRIIGLPGETVKIKNGNIIINGEYLSESYGNETIEKPGIAKKEIQLGDDEYFVLGDNRNASIDSRDEQVGNIKRAQIKGKVWLRFYPFNNFGVIE